VTGSLSCPDPKSCPVPSIPRGPSRFATTVLNAGSPVWRVYRLQYGYDSFNPGIGDTRFAPLITKSGPVPTLYGGYDEVSALLESVLHDVHHSAGERVIYEAVLRDLGLARVRVPADMQLVDLRNSALADRGLSRQQIVTTTAEHYPCTRQWAVWLHRTRHSGILCDGIVWHSRQSELHQADTLREVFMLFGDRVPSDPGSYPLSGPGVRNLTEGPGRLLLERLAEELEARIEPAND